MVPERVVDFLEPIEVHHQQCYRRAVTFGSADGLLQAVVQQDAIRQVGQRVVQRLMFEGGLGPLAQADIAHAEDQQVLGIQAHLAHRQVGREHLTAAAAANRFARPQAVQEQAHVVANHVGRGVAKDPLGGGIEGCDAVRVLDGDDPLGDVVEHGPQVGFIRAQLLHELRIANGVGGQGANRVEQLAVSRRKRLVLWRARQADLADDLARAAQGGGQAMVGAGVVDARARDAHGLARGRQAELGGACTESVQDLADDEIRYLRDAQVAGEHFAQLVQEVQLLIRVDDLCSQAIELVVL